MEYEKIMETIAHSKPAEWKQLDADNVYENRYLYKNDVKYRIYERVSDRDAPPWAEYEGDTEGPSMNCFEIYYDGKLIDQISMIYVDGGYGIIPFAQPHGNRKSLELTITRIQYELCVLLNYIENPSQYVIDQMYGITNKAKRYLKRYNITVE